MKIRNKLLLTFALLVIPPLLLTVLANAFLVTPLTKKYAIELEGKTVTQYRNSLDHSFQFYNNISKSIISDRTIMEAVRKEYTGIQDVTMTYLTVLQPYVNSYLKLNQNLQKITIFVDNPTLNKDNYIIADLQALKEEPTLYKIINTSPADQCVVFEGNTIKLYRRIASTQKNQLHCGVIELTINTNELKRLIGDNKEDIFVMDSQGKTLSLSENLNIPQALDTGDLNFSQPSGILELTDPQQALLLYDTTSFDWKVMKQVRPSDAFSEALRTRRFIDILVLLCAALITLLIFIFSWAFSQRLNQLIQKILIISQRQFQKLPIIRGRDEISEASSALDYMAEEFQRYIATEYQWELDNTRLKLDLAYARINPHFFVQLSRCH